MFVFTYDSDFSNQNENISETKMKLKEGETEATKNVVFSSFCCFLETQTIQKGIKMWCLQSKVFQSYDFRILWFKMS
jgi:hypothetical protein